MPKEGETGARLTSGDLQLSFVWRGDRFEQQIVVGESKFESVESDAYDTPVFQEVHQQGEVVFASGLSGGRHWSASVEPVSDGLVFDVACRVKSEGRPAAACYEGVGLRLRSDDVEAVKISAPPEAKRFLAIPAEPTSPLPSTVRCRYSIIRP